MQVFTIQMLLDLVHQANEIKQMLFDTLLSAALQNVLTFVGSVWAVVVRHDWSALPMKLFLLVGGIALVYRLVRSKPFMALKSIFDR